MLSQERRTQGTVLPVMFILLIGLGVVSVGVYQAHVLPAIASDEEIAADRALLSDVLELDYAVRSSIISGEPQPVTAGSTIDYPLLMTPKQPTYSIQTAESWRIDIENYDCTSGSCLAATNTTNVITYGDYSYFDAPRVYGYEYGVVYSAPEWSSEGDDRIVVHTNQMLIDGTNLSIVSFGGNYSNARQNTVHTTITRRNTDVQSFTVTSATSDGINVTLPTELPESAWTALLEDELVANGGSIESTHYASYRTIIEEGETSPSSEQEHFQDCDHSGKGQPFVKCTTDDSTNFITLTLAPDQEYEVTLQQFELEE